MLAFCGVLTMNDRIKNAIDQFNLELNKYRTFSEYSNCATLVCVPDESGFDVVINDVNFFHVAEFAFYNLSTFVYCAIGIMRAFFFGDIERRAE